MMAGVLAAEPAAEEARAALAGSSSARAEAPSACSKSSWARPSTRRRRPPPAPPAGGMCETEVNLPQAFTALTTALRVDPADMTAIDEAERLAGTPTAGPSWSATSPDHRRDRGRVAPRLPPGPLVPRQCRADCGIAAYQQAMPGPTAWRPPADRSSATTLGEPRRAARAGREETGTARRSACCGAGRPAIAMASPRRPSTATNDRRPGSGGTTRWRAGVSQARQALGQAAKVLEARRVAGAPASQARPACAAGGHPARPEAGRPSIARYQTVLDGDQATSRPWRSCTKVGPATTARV
jgi:hypothetical protein